MSKLIYFPSFSSKYSLLKKDEFTIKDLQTVRFYDDRFPKEFQHKFFLLTAGAFYNRKTNIREELGMNNGTLVLGDSGGFQIANGTIPWNMDIRDRIFHWLEDNSDIAMNLDIPPNLKYRGKFDYCLEESYNNFKYFEEKQTGKTKFLNVIQTNETDEGYSIWYDKVKDFQFNGWGIGGTLKQHSRALYIIALFLKNREFEKLNNHYIHFLGATSPFNFLIYQAIQKNFNKYYPHIQVTTDSSTPLLQPVYGNWVHSINNKKLNFNYLYFGNKGKVKYEEEKELPCILHNCPVCSRIKYTEIANYKNQGEYSIHVGWHNLFVFIQSIENMGKLLESGNDVLTGFYDREVIAMIKSIDAMFKDPDKALVIYNENLKLYKKLSNNLETLVDKSVLNSDIFESEEKLTKDIDEELKEIMNESE